MMKKLSIINETLWGDSLKRSQGLKVRKEDDIDSMDRDRFFEYLQDTYIKVDIEISRMLKSSTPGLEYISMPIFKNGYKLYRLSMHYENNKMTEIVIQAFVEDCKSFFNEVKNKFYVTTSQRNGGLRIMSKEGKVSNTICLDLIDTIIENDDNAIYKKSVDESLWGNSVKRSRGEEVRKENVIKILYHPETLDELKKIIKKEIKEQGGIDVDLRMIDVSNIKNVGGAFYYSSLQSLDLSNWDVSNVEDMCGMFNGCKSLKSLNISNWDVSNVEDMSYMFFGCKSLQSLDVSKWDVSKMKDMSFMFADCSSLQSLDLPNWDVSKVDVKYMFNNCPIQYKKQGNRLVRI